MSESQLNREFSKRDVQRMRNIVTGNTANFYGGGIFISNNSP